MKRTIAVIFSLGALLAMTAVAQASSVAFFHGASNGRAVKPRNVYLSADGTLDVYKMKWIKWGTSAVGFGTAHFHGCTPNCAAGKDHARRVVVRLDHRVRCKGVAYFNRVQLFDRRSLKPLFVRDLSHDAWAPCRLP
jgi:hypothetical protein